MSHHKEFPPFSRLFVICCKTLKEEDLQRAFGEHGHIDNLYMPRDRSTGDSKGIAYIQYLKTSEAATALEALHGHTLESSNRPLKVMIAADRYEQNQSGNIDLDKHKRLFILVPKLADETAINEHFSTFGEVESVRLQKDKNTQQNKGFAYVNFNTFVDAARALEKCDRKYKPKFATPRDDLKRNRSTFESNSSLNSYNTNHSNYRGDKAFGLRDNMEYKDFYLPRKPTGDEYKSVIVTCSTNLTQKHVEKLFDLINGMERCQYSVDLFRGCGKGVITYSNASAAACAVEKLNNFEYPLGETISVKPDTNPINKAANDISNIVSNFKNAMSSGNSPQLAQLAEAISQASSIIQEVASRVSDNNSPNESLSFCNVKLPPPRPLADINSPTAQRCFIVCQPEVPSLSMLREVFSRFGDLIKFYMVPMKNFGYVHYASVKSAQEAMTTLNKCTIAGSYIKVLEADERNPKADNNDESKKMKLDTMDVNDDL